MSSVARLRAGAWEDPTSSRTRGRRRARSWSAQKIHFAFEIFVVQIVIVCVLQTVLQMHVTHELARAASIETADLLRGIFFATLRTLTWVGPLVTLLSVLVAVRFSDRYAASSHRLRVAMRQLADGDPGVRLRLGPGDALEGLDEDFNRLAEMLAQKRRDRGDTTPSG